MYKNHPFPLLNSKKLRRVSGGRTRRITAQRLTLKDNYLNIGDYRNSGDNQKLTVNGFGGFNKKNKRKSTANLIKKKFYNNTQTASDYFISRITNCKKIINENNQSIFNEINLKYNNEIILKEKSLFFNELFVNKLKKQLKYNKQLKGDNCLKQSINDEINKINEFLLIKQKTNFHNNNNNNRRGSGGKRIFFELDKNNKKKMSGGGSRKRQIIDDDKENIPMKYPFVPKSNWIFQTPPNRKLNFDHMKITNNNNDNNIIQPAVLRTCKQKTIVYEMNKKINVDLTRFHNKQEIDIDRRYMIECTNNYHHQNQQNNPFEYNNKNSTSRNLNNIITMGAAAESTNPTTGVTEDTEMSSTSSSTSPDNNNIQFVQPDPYELEHHFLSLTCRPKKAISTVSRIRRHRELLRSISANGISTITKSTSSSSTTTTATSDITILAGNRTNTPSPPPSPLSKNNEFIVTTSTSESSKRIMDDDEFEADFSVINPNPDCIEESFTFKFTPTSCKSGTVAGRLFDFDGNEKDSFTFECD